MLKEELKKINVEVSYQCWKDLKILAMQKDISFQQCVKDILERSVGRFNKKIVIEEKEVTHD